MLVLVSNRKRNTYRYRRKLFKLDLRYENGKWRLKTSDEDQIYRIERFCKRKHLSFECIDDMYVRSADYRKRFIQQYRRKNGKYFRCAYCGRKLTSQNMTVDHIIPIDRVQREKRYRRLMKRLGINNVNDVRNLTPSCERCNKRKGRQLKGYYFRGVTGRTYNGVLIRRFLKFIFVLFLMCILAVLISMMLNYDFSSVIKN